MVSLAVLLAASAAHAGPPVVKLGGHIETSEAGSVSVRAIVEIASGYHINAHVPDEPFLIPTVLTLGADGIEFAKPTYPEPDSQEFEFAPDKPMLVYDGTIEILAGASPKPDGPVHAKLRYQACNHERCLPPTTVEAFLGKRSAAAAGGTTARLAGTGTDDSWLFSWLQGASLPAALGMTLLLGLTLNLTPCVYPLISVTLGFFGTQANDGKKPWPLAITYVMGITLSFAALGVTASLAGGLFGAPLQHPAVLVSLALLLGTLSMSSFGFFELRAPSALMTRFGGASTGLGGAFLMGLTMGIVAAPCIGPVVLGLLVYVGSERDVWKGFLLFSSMGLGMGLPYVFLASAAGSLDKLPRSGEWLSWMNRLFGVLLLGMAVYFVSPLIGHDFMQIFFPLFVAAAAVYLGFLEPSGRSLRGFTMGRRLAGCAALVFAAWIGLSSAQAGPGIQWQPLTPKALGRALTARQPAIVEFSAEWCLPCVEMEHSTFTDPNVLRDARRFSMLQADVTESSDENDHLLEEFGVLGVPTIIFYDSAGHEVDRVVGYVDAQEFRTLMRQVGGASAPAPKPLPPKIAEPA
ncbi:MAG: cytochrome c biogenesis protein CcdA [Candidatus Binatia bacterium]|nr:cytochrome c biogenesis protein CcdA [Candidatus Binatia bacterium]